MSKTRNDAAKILIEKGWTFEEIESVLVKKATKAKVHPQKQINQTKSKKA
ncbi:MAG: hypothetical protein HWQ38_24155 [Nostoc sp. NMS7]|nr:hypothetical protein [Nostoc sp. NMS7]MBN3949387.1 hypothetical protein [Nostoc sp. NMS7]